MRPPVALAVQVQGLWFPPAPLPPRPDWVQPAENPLWESWMHELLGNLDFHLDDVCI